PEPGGDLPLDGIGVAGWHWPAAHRRAGRRCRRRRPFLIGAEAVYRRARRAARCGRGRGCGTRCRAALALGLRRWHRLRQWLGFRLRLWFRFWLWQRLWFGFGQGHQLHGYGLAHRWHRVRKPAVKQPEHQDPMQPQGQHYHQKPGSPAPKAGLDVGLHQGSSSSDATRLIRAYPAFCRLFINRISVPYSTRWTPRRQRQDYRLPAVWAWVISTSWAKVTGCSWTKSAPSACTVMYTSSSGGGEAVAALEGRSTGTSTVASG